MCAGLYAGVTTPARSETPVATEEPDVFVGDIVHYADNQFETGQGTLAAIVTHVHEDGRVNLTVFHNTFEEHIHAVSYDTADGDGTWSWSG